MNINFNTWTDESMIWNSLSDEEKESMVQFIWEGFASSGVVQSLKNDDVYDKYKNAILFISAEKFSKIRRQQTFLLLNNNAPEQNTADALFKCIWDFLKKYFTNIMNNDPDYRITFTRLLEFMQILTTRRVYVNLRLEQNKKIFDEFKTYLPICSLFQEIRDAQVGNIMYNNPHMQTYLYKPSGPVDRIWSPYTKIGQKGLKSTYEGCNCSRISLYLL